MQRKGFMHIVEIILVGLMVFVIFMQFSSIPQITTGWPRTKLSIIAEDALLSLKERGVDWYNKDQVDRELGKILPNGTIYGLEIRNTLKPEITVACKCVSDSDYADFLEIVKPGWFYMNGRNVTIKTARVLDLREAFSLNYDVVVFFKHEAQLTGNDFRTPLENFLRNDRGVVEIFDFTNEMEYDAVQRTYFGLAPSFLVKSSGTLQFSEDAKNPEEEGYKLYKYYSHIPLFSDDFPDRSQWTDRKGSSVISGEGNPAPGLSLQQTADGCPGRNTVTRTTSYQNFRTGVVEMDIRLPAGSVLYIDFRMDPAGDSGYAAMVSSNSSIGYGSFFTMNGGSLTPIGSNFGSLTTPNQWKRIRIESTGSQFRLYENGALLATAPDYGTYSAGRIGFSNRCGDVLVDNVRVKALEENGLQNFLANSENTTSSTNDLGKAVLIDTATQIPYVAGAVLNYEIVSGSGRTAWISEGDDSLDERKALIKSAIVWASGDTYYVRRSDLLSPVAAIMYDAEGSDMFMPREIILNVAYVY